MSLGFEDARLFLLPPLVSRSEYYLLSLSGENQGLPYNRRPARGSHERRRIGKEAGRFAAVHRGGESVYPAVAGAGAGARCGGGPGVWCRWRRGCLLRGVQDSEFL